MKSSAIFNNKGGVGNFTLTLLIADFFSSTKVTIGDRQARVLVVDPDAQNSSRRRSTAKKPYATSRQET